MGKVYVVGMGPGHKDYILPTAIEVVKGSEAIIGAPRHLEIFQHLNSTKIPIDGPLRPILNYIKENHSKKLIALLVSGDPAFYSLLNLVKKEINDESYIEIIPGISSLQYLFSKIKITCEDIKRISLHGRNDNLMELFKKEKKLALLTDKKYTPEFISKKLIESGFNDAYIVVGENLSYSKERIIKGKPSNIISSGPYKMNVVVIFNEQ